MKKILILILCSLFLGGCYDNIELNNLAIISGIGIDYEDDNFILTYEVLNDTKTDENTAMLSYTEEGKGKSIVEAFTNTNYKIGKKPYFAHLRVVLLSETIIKDHLDEISDYLIRDTDIRDEFISVVVKDSTPKEVLTHNSKNIPVVSDLIINLLDNEKYNNNLSVTDTFQQVLAKFISHNQDAVLSSLTINENDEITLSNFYFFKGYYYQDTLTEEESSFYNLLTKDVFGLKVENEYEKGNVVINISHSKPEIEVTSDKIKINLKLDGKILDNNADFDLKSEKSYQELNKDFSLIIKDKVTSFIQKLQANKSDILGLQEIYFKKWRKENHNLWETADIEVKIDLKINTKGFIFEVENEK